jgi:hemerythrin
MTQRSDQVELPAALTTGVPEIDRQHLYLVRLLNDTDNRLESDRRPALVDQVSLDLLNYALLHFATEERLMAEYGYQRARADERDAHLREHRVFTERVTGFRARLKAGDPLDPAELTSFMRAWLVDHIPLMDQKLAGFILERRGRSI